MTVSCEAETGLKEIHLSIGGSEKMHHLENVVVEITANIADKRRRKWT